MKKIKNYHKILLECIRLEIKHGHLKWTMTHLSKNTQTPRNLLYYHFGKEKLQIVLEAAHLIGKNLSGFDKERMRFYTEKKYEDSLALSRNLFLECPAIIPFYFYQRVLDNEIGRAIRYYESMLIQKIQFFFPHITKKKASAIATVYLGIGFSPFIESNSDIKEVIKLISY